jgi:hypothetical protein
VSLVLVSSGLRIHVVPVMKSSSYAPVRTSSLVVFKLISLVIVTVFEAYESVLPIVNTDSPNAIMENHFEVEP